MRLLSLFAFLFSTMVSASVLEERTVGGRWDIARGEDLRLVQVGGAEALRLTVTLVDRRGAGDDGNDYKRLEFDLSPVILQQPDYYTLDSNRGGHSVNRFDGRVRARLAVLERTLRIERAHFGTRFSPSTKITISER
jgi:hypothetical protein